MGTVYKINGFSKRIEEDSYEKGCLPGKAREYWCDRECFCGATVEEAVEKFRAHADAEKSAVLIDSCGDIGRVDIQTLECADCTQPNDEELERWKKGELVLYACTYIGYVKKVTTEDVCLLDSLRGLGYEERS